MGKKTTCACLLQHAPRRTLPGKREGPTWPPTGGPTARRRLTPAAWPCPQRYGRRLGSRARELGSRARVRLPLLGGATRGPPARATAHGLREHPRPAMGRRRPRGRPGSVTEATRARLGEPLVAGAPSRLQDGWPLDEIPSARRLAGWRVHPRRYPRPGEPLFLSAPRAWRCAKGGRLPPRGALDESTRSALHPLRLRHRRTPLIPRRSSGWSSVRTGMSYGSSYRINGV